MKKTKYIIGDIGNSLTKISLLDHKLNISKSYNIKTKKLLNKNNNNIFFNKIINHNVNKKILFSSVVPSVYKIIKSQLKKKKFKVIEIKELNIKKIIKLKVKKINDLGSDRISNAIGSLYNYKNNCIVIDFGTATTFDIINKPIFYEGGVITPGINSSILNLNKSAELLPVINLKYKKKAYGKDTKEAINSGFLWGYQGLINNIIQKICTAKRLNYKIILTGGYAPIFKKLISRKPVIDQNITMKGIIKIYKDLII